MSNLIYNIEKGAISLWIIHNIILLLCSFQKNKNNPLIILYI